MSVREDDEGWIGRERHPERKQEFGLAEALGLNGTPSLVIGDDVIVGAVGFELAQAQINTARCGKASC